MEQEKVFVNVIMIQQDFYMKNFLISRDDKIKDNFYYFIGFCLNKNLHIDIYLRFQK